MKKFNRTAARITAVILAAILLFGTIPATATTFRDVPVGAWYYQSVTIAAERGIISGRGDGLFDPDGTLTVAEAIKLAVGQFEVAHPTDKIPDGETSPWYDKYFAYAVENNIIDAPPENPNAAATRAQFAEWIYRSSPTDQRMLNDITPGDIRDLPLQASYRDAVTALYGFGILTGSDVPGMFYPARNLTRAEAATILARTLDIGLRRSGYSLPELTSEGVYSLSVDAAVLITTYNADGKLIRDGSGFFISADGLIATNLHVLRDSHTVVITTSDGTQYDATGALAYSTESNVAVLKIDASGLTWLAIADSDRVKIGDAAYSLGHPYGLDGTFSRGSVSYIGRNLDGLPMLQFTASISQGSGGGALVDSRGRIIGITMSSINGGDKLNFAVPSNHITQLKLGSLVPFSEIDYTGLSV